MAQTHAQRFLESSMAATMPQMRQQQETMRRILQGHGQRVGSKGAVAQSRKAVDAFATQSGNVAARLGADAESMGQQQEQFDKKVAMDEARFAESQKQNKLNQMMSQFQATGIWTPEMIEAFGYDLSKGEQRDIQKQKDILGAGAEGGGPASGPFGQNNQMLFNRAMQPGPSIGSNRAQRNQQAWLQSQFG